jgi:hypothetical protein
VIRAGSDRRRAVGDSTASGEAGKAEIVKSKLINDGPQKTYVLVFDKGDEAVSSIEALRGRTASPPRN